MLGNLGCVQAMHVIFTVPGLISLVVGLFILGILVGAAYHMAILVSSLGCVQAWHILFSISGVFFGVIGLFISCISQAIFRVAGWLGMGRGRLLHIVDCVQVW